MNEINIFNRTRMSMAILLALSPVALQMAHAGAGFGDNTSSVGTPIKVPTFYANSPSGLRPADDCFDTTGAAAVPTLKGLCDTGTPLQKFVDTLPGLGSSAANDLGQYIPIAVPDTTSYPGSDYYEIAVVDYTEKMHKDLVKATHLRGYVQLSTAIVPGKKVSLAVKLPDGTTEALAVDNPHYLGPLIMATKGRAVRIKYYNLLPTGAAGKLFLPVDATYTEAGILPGNVSKLTENRAAIHWHGGDTPWISDGTPHQWIAPATEVIPGTTIPMGKGVSAEPVPDMPAPGAGAQTLYFPNNMSGRFMFYHDHTAGLTRLNVYAGIAAGYLLTDPTETSMVNGTIATPLLDSTGASQKDAAGKVISFAAGTLPADQIPLVIQDKTFVPKDIAQQDSYWNQDITGNKNLTVWGSEADLWFPHVYETNQDPSSLDATNPVGRWDWGPWFWPVFPAAYSLPSGLVGDASSTPEAFMDTPIVNGTAYPTTTVQPKAYRFRILNASNDRFLNLGLYQATTGVSQIAISANGSGYSTDPRFPPKVVITNAAGDTTGHGATAVATVDPGTGSITRIDMTNVGADYTAPVSLSVLDNIYVADTTKTPAVVAHAAPGGFDFAASGSITMDQTEVEMVAFDATQAAKTPFPTSGGLQGTGWGTLDSMQHPSGVPNPTKLGPDIIQIGTEGGFLPHAVTIPSTPINYEYNKRSVTVLNVLEHGVWMGPAERVDAVIDFSQYAGKTLILYNDAPAPLPAGDPRIDYYSGAPDQTGAGGAAPTLAGYGPNTRTIMQIKVSSGTPKPFDVVSLQAALPKAYAVEQVPPVIPEIAYNDAFGTHDADNLLKISTGSMAQPTLNFTPTGPMTLTGVNLQGGGTGYRAAPTVTFVNGLGAATTACPIPRAATAKATIDLGTRMVTGFTSFNAGCGYTSMPTVQLTATNGGTGATANGVSNTTKTLPVQNKGIQELFDPVYGRMNATFSVELPFTTATTQTTIPLAYIDPATEKIADGETQIWKITHNGVDSHPVHFHLVNVQVINRVGWDGTIKPPYDNEFGWKETLRMNPLEDVYVAATAKQPKTNSFGLPQSVRLRDPSQKADANLGFTQINPVTGAPATVVNTVDNYNNEYVWHCHILGHEENDFMRPVVFQPRSFDSVANAWKTTLDAPAAPTLRLTSGVLNWVDNSDKEIQFNIERAPLTNGATGTFANVGIALANAGMQSWISPVSGVGKNAGIITDATRVTGQSYQYRVAAVGAAATGASVIDTTTLSYSNVVTFDVAPLAPTSLTLTPGTCSSATSCPVALSWPDSSTNETGFVVEYGIGATPATWTSATVTISGTTTRSATVTGLNASTQYSFRVSAVNSAAVAGTAGSFVTKSATTNGYAVVQTAPATPSGVSIKRTSITAATLAWTDASNNETSFQVQTSSATGTPTWTNLDVAIARNAAQGMATGGGLTYAAAVTASTNLLYRVEALNASPTGGISASVTLNDTVAPVAATGVTGTTTTLKFFGFTVSTTVTLNWADAANNNVSYTFQRSTNNGSTWTNVSTTLGANVTSTSQTVGGAISKNQFRVLAVNSVGSTASAVYTTP